MFLRTFLLFWLFSTPPLFAEPLALVTGNEYPPFTDESLPNGGVFTEIVRRSFALVDQTVTVDFLPWQRGYDETRAHRYIATFPYVKNEERLADFAYSEVVFRVRTLLFVQRNSTIDFQTAESLRGLRACKPLGYFTQDIDPLVAQGILTLQRVPRLENCFKMLALSRVDLVPIDEFVGWQALQTLHGARARGLFRALEQPLESVDLHLIIAHNHPFLTLHMTRFNEGLALLRRTGEFDRIINTYLGGNSP